MQQIFYIRKSWNSDAAKKIVFCSTTENSSGNFVSRSLPSAITDVTDIHVLLQMNGRIIFDRRWIRGTQLGPLFGQQQTLQQGKLLFTYTNTEWAKKEAVLLLVVTSSIIDQFKLIPLFFFGNSFNIFLAPRCFSIHKLKFYLLEWFWPA